MKVTLLQLRTLLEQELSERSTHTKKSSDDESLPYGKYLFGATRGKPNRRNFERDTKEEEKLEDELSGHYHGDGLGSSVVGKLTQLKNDGIYTDVLSPPASVTHAYRLMSDISLKTLSKIIGYEPTDFDDEEVYEAERGIFTPLRGQRHHSWTIDPNVFKKILSDWGWFTDFDDKKLHFMVVMRAPMSGNNFLFNPKETREIADEYAYQKEVISVDTVKCDHVWYISMNKDGPAADKRVIKKLYNTNFG